MLKNKLKNRYCVHFRCGINPYHWEEYVNARDERGAEYEARKVFNYHGKPLGWVNNIELLEEGTRN